MNNPVKDATLRAIIGTAGHVDHGKTALIKSLTGMNTARSHEEARGMTLDLGFAHFNDDDGNTIGVIDVPGHERFIRNMVAGVWSLDLVLLVVAADEGWMPMTTEHLSVAKAMGVRNVILCINKCDTVDADTLSLVEEDALENCMDILGDIPESICVSALNGDNIDALRRLVVRQLLNAPERVTAQHSHVYIDRVFTVNGIGTVVTGSLAGDSLKIGDRMKLYPSGKEVQVRTLQSYHQNLEEAHPVSRVAVGLKGVSRKELERGHCLVSLQSACTLTDQLFVRMDMSEEDINKNRKNREVEVAVGTWHGLGQLVNIRGTRLGRLKLTMPAPCFWGQSLAMIRHGGSELVYSGRIVWTDDIDVHRRKPLQNLLDNLPEQLEPLDQVRLRLNLHGYAPAAGLSESDLGDNYRWQGEWILSHSFIADTLTKIMALFEQGGESTAMTLGEISSRLKVEAAVLDLLLQQLKQEERLFMKRDAWMQGTGASEDDLGADARALLKMIDESGKNGFEATKVKVPGAQKLLRNLVRQGFVTPFEGKIYYTTDLYNQLVQEILKGLQVEERFALAHVKECTGLSRKYMIPLLSRMELDGWVRRDDNERIVLKQPEADRIAA